MTKILLVEDDKSLREIYSVRLLAEGYTLISSGDGEEALAAAIGEKPDLIVSDVMMPKISGFEMLDLLRSNDSTKNIPVIMLTALSSEQQRDRGSRLGADRYLIKSQVGIEDIVRTVHEVLGDGGQQPSVAQMESATINQPAAQPQPQSIQQASSSISEQQQTSAQTAESVPSVHSQPQFQQQTTIQQPNYVNGPANFQSSFNPPAAVNPASTAGVQMPNLPDSPMNIPSRMAQQPGMPASYNAALQSANNPFYTPGTSNQQQPVPQQTPTQTINNPFTFTQSQTQQAPVQQPGQQQPTEHAQQYSIPYAQPAVNNQQMQPQPQQPSGFMQQTATPAHETSVNQPQLNNAASTVPLSQGSERVVEPPRDNQQPTSPQINIDELLAGATDEQVTSTGLFPRSGS